MKRIYKATISVVLVMALMMMFTGCDQTKKAEKIAMRLMDAIVAIDQESVQKYATNTLAPKYEEYNNETWKAIAQAISEKTTYAVTSSAEAEENIQVTVEVTALDMASIAKDIHITILKEVAENPEQTAEAQNARVTELYKEAVSKEDASTANHAVTLTMTKIDGDWKTEITDELLDALYGGTVSAIDKITATESTVSGLIDAINTVDDETVNQYILDPEDNECSDLVDMHDEDWMVVGGLIGSKTTYRFIDWEEVDETTVNVSAQITSIDMRPIMKEVYPTFIREALVAAFSGHEMTDEEISTTLTTLFKDALSKENLATIQKTVTVKVVNVDGEWKAEITDELLNACYGGVSTALDEVEKSMN